MSFTPLISIVIPTYNRADFIGRTIESVLDQNYPNFELIIVDDGSTDTTEEVVRTFEDKRIHYHYTHNHERGAARNFGMERANGDYLTFLDSDDLFYRDHLITAVNFIKEHSPELFFQQYELIDPKGNKRIPYLPSRTPLNRELVLKGNFMSCHGVFLTRSIYQVHQFNEDRDLAGSEDYELWLRLAARYPILYSPKITNALIEHPARSVLNIDPEKLIKRKERMVGYLKEDPVFMKSYGHYWSKLSAGAYAYIALHLVLMKEKRSAFNYATKAIGHDPFYIFKKRLWVVFFRLFSF